MLWAYDIETTTDWETIRVVGFHNGTDTHICASRLEVGRFLIDHIHKGDELVSWNGHKFDNDVLMKVWHLDLPEVLSRIGAVCHDAMIFAKMLYPDMPGGHSLDNFSKKYVPSYKPWKPYDLNWYNTCSISELVTYLKKDLEATRKVAIGLEHDSKFIGGKWIHAQKVEERVREITNEQVDKAVRFNLPAAEELWMTLAGEMDVIERDLEDWLPTLPVSNPKAPPKKQFKQDGTLSLLMSRYIASMGLVYDPKSQTVIGVGGFYRTLPFTDPAPQFEQLTLSNQTKVKEWLLSKGWKPTWWNTKQDPVSFKKLKTTPRLNHSVSKAPCKDLMRFGSQGEQITKWLMLRARRSMLANEKRSTGLIAKASKGGGYIASEADTCGTPTARWRHKGIVNIPRVTSPYGKEIRSLFEARPGMSWVGWDASSLEACIEAHYTYPYDPDYALSLTEGDSSKGTDVHSRNMMKLGLESRDKAKTFKYAITYGAQAASLAEQIGVPRSQGEMLFDEFWRQNEGLRELRDQLLAEWKHYNKKYIIGLDGRLIATRSEHSLINTKFQSGGAIVMKHAMLIANKEIKAYAAMEGIQAYGLIRYHDEEQWETNGDANQRMHIGQMGCDSITKAGKYLKLNVPLSGDYKTGKNWADTH